MPKLTLFYSPACPYCAKVISFMKENDMCVPLRNRDESAQTRQELVDLGGKTQVPCLIIDGEAMYESDAIIDWLKENYSDTRKSGS